MNESHKLYFFHYKVSHSKFECPALTGSDGSVSQSEDSSVSGSTLWGQIRVSDTPTEGNLKWDSTETCPGFRLWKCPKMWPVLNWTAQWKQTFVIFTSCPLDQLSRNLNREWSSFSLRPSGTWFLIPSDWTLDGAEKVFPARHRRLRHKHEAD